MKILIAGASGMIGSALGETLKSEGFTVAMMVRDRDLLTDETAFWDPFDDTIDIPKLDWIGGTEGFRAVVNVAGESMANGKWTEEYKQRIRDSRVKPTALLANALTELKVKPGVLVNASAIGIYGDRGEALLDESSPPGNDGFLVAVCKLWEAATKPASDAGIRVVNTRFGLVLSTKGGALKRMITMAKIGGAAPLGEGNQWWSWVTIDDAVRAIIHVIQTESISGPVNVTNTNPLRNVDFSHSMQYYFKAPIHMHIPPFVLRMMVGEMADEVLLASQKALPVKLRQTGFKFRHENLEPALRYLTSERVEDLEKELGG